MKKYLNLLLVFLLLSATGFSQKVISGKSEPTRLKLNPKYKRGIPPNLFVNLSFEDNNQNGILEPNELALLKLTITNKGKGPAQGLLVSVKDDSYDPELVIESNKKIPYLYPDQSIIVDIPMKAGFNIKSAEHKLEISIKENYGYDMDPAYLVLNTMEYLEPQLVFSGLEVVDVGSGTAAIIEDGQVQPGELVKVKLVIQNIGQNVSKNTSFVVNSNDKNIYLTDYQGELGDLAIGEVKEFWITVSPNKRVDIQSKLPIYLSLRNEHERGILENYKLPISLNQRPPQPEIVEVKADVERLQEQVARFEYTSNKITTNIENVIDIQQVSPSGTIRSNAVAIVIGVEKYRYFASAPYASNDAELVKKYFKNILGIKDVFIYTDDDVSGFFFDNIFNPQYGELQKTIVKGKTDLFVFYSGHGMPSKDGSEVFLFPSDGRIEALNSQGYNFNTFLKNLELLGAKSTTVFVDACFSGVSRTSNAYAINNLVAMKGVSIKAKVDQPWETDPNFSLFTSSSFEETSLGFDASETGLFTYYLCAGLQGNADVNKDGKVTMSEVRDYVIENVSKTSVKIHGKQTPMFYGDDDQVLIEFH